MPIFFFFPFTFKIYTIFYYTILQLWKRKVRSTAIKKEQYIYTQVFLELRLRRNRHFLSIQDQVSKILMITITILHCI